MMNEQEAQDIMSDPEFQATVFNNLMQIFVLPEILRRQEKGELPNPFHLVAAQVLLYPDTRGNVVRLNEEVRIIARATPTADSGLIGEVGEFVKLDQIESIDWLFPANEDDPDCGYIIFAQIKGQWIGTFNSVYNRSLSRKHLIAARQFLSTAQHAFEHEYWPAFIDTLYSASELAAKALLLGHRTELRNAKKHSSIHSEFNKFTNLGNVGSEHRKTFNKLSKLRPDARYLDKDIELTEADAQRMLTEIQELIEKVEKRVS